MSDYQGKPLNGVDTAWLRMDSPTNLMIINAMLITEPMDYALFRKTIQNRFLYFPRFFMLPVHQGGEYVWENDALFNLDNHVKKVALPDGADKKALQGYLADQLSVPFDDSKPLWQMLFVENYEGGTALIFRVHHCYADGLALISVFNSITDAVPHADSLSYRSRASNEEHASAKNKRKRFSGHALSNARTHTDKYGELARKLSTEGLNLLRDQDELGKLLGDGVRAAAEIAQLAAMPSDPQSTLKGDLGVRKQCAWSDPISFDRFHGVAKVIGCSINDLLLSCVTGALREQLIDAGEDLDGRAVHVTVPVNIRQSSPEDVTDKPDDLGNYFGTVFVNLPVGVENPLERVYKIKHDMLALKHSLQPALSYGILYAAGLLPKAMQKALTESFGNKASGVLSNVPGPREARYLAGSKIKEQMFWVPQTGAIGLGMSIISYGGQIQFGLIGDAGLFPNPEKIVKRFVAQIDMHRSDVVASYIEDLVHPSIVL